MWYNYFLTTIRSLSKSTFYVMANLVSLGVAFALMIVGYFNYEFNHSFNQFFPDASRIYKVNSARVGYPDAYGMGITPAALGTYLADELGEHRVARFQGASVVVRKDKELLPKRAAYIDPSFLTLFPFYDQEGSHVQLVHQSGVLITRKMAEAIFDRSDVVGELLQFQDERVGRKAFEVVGVIDDFPENTSFRFDVLFPFEAYYDHAATGRNDWSQWIGGTFVKVDDPKSGLTEVGALLNGYLNIQNEHNPEREVVHYKLDNILEWPTFESRLHQSRFVGVLHPASVLGTISSAVFILLLACVNFVNISISLSGRRLKEIAMRKVFGGTRSAIIWQFMIENLLLVMASVGLAIAIASWLIPSYNALFEFNIVQFRFLNWGPFIVFSLIVFALVIAIAGGYPALYISRFPSLTIFRQKAKIGGSGKLLGVLVALQFVICFYNVFSLIVFVENANYQETLDRGYDITHVLNIPVSNAEQHLLIASAISQDDRIRHMGRTEHLIGFHSESEKIRMKGADAEIASLNVGEGYLETMKVRLVNGRSLRKGDVGKPTVMVNELMERLLGGQAVGQNIQIGQQSCKVVGVVEDFNLRTILLDNEIKPAIIRMTGNENIRYVSIRGDFGGDQQLLARMEQQWYELFPDQLFQGFMQERVVRPLRQTNRIVISINSFVAIMAILISTLGLYATVSLAIGRRIKELGIRKVLGATIWQITYILNSRLMLILLISSFLGLLGGYLFISDLLDIIYAYHINIGMRHLLAPVVVILGIVLASIGWKIGKAVGENPVKQLRTE